MGNSLLTIDTFDALVHTGLGCRRTYRDHSRQVKKVLSKINVGRAVPFIGLVLWSMEEGWQAGLCAA